MRILIANDGFGDAGGVQTYLDAAIANLAGRGHELALAYCSKDGTLDASGVSAALPRFHLPHADDARAFDAVRRWSPDLCYSHNMDDVAIDRRLGASMPIVKFMHGYFGTCIGGLKTHRFPGTLACGRVYGPACAALYFPRRCGQLSPAAFVRQWRAAESHRSVRDVYAAYVVASEHMKREYVRSGIDASRVHANPLFSTAPVAADVPPAPAAPRVLFLGRMTPLKGGDLLIRAIAAAAARLPQGHAPRLTMVGDGPSRQSWESLAVSLGVPCTFAGWQTGDARWPYFRDASLVAVPSLWPEPFGLVGLEAGAFGVPAVGIDTGGISEWLEDGVNGRLVQAPAAPDTLGAAIAGVLGDPALQARLRAGAHRIAREMSVDRHVDRLEAVFVQALPARA
jgi:glycosyltransferase involved in cell wall biosynthesis